MLLYPKYSVYNEMLSNLRVNDISSQPQAMGASALHFYMVRFSQITPSLQTDKTKHEISYSCSESRSTSSELTAVDRF